MAEFDCRYCDEYGFCTKYSNDAVVWKCTDPNCKDYKENDNEEK